MVQAVEATRAENKIRLPFRVYHTVYQRLIEEGLSWYAQLHLSPEGPSATDIQNWSSYFHTTTHLYGQLAAINGHPRTFAFSPEVKQLQASSPRLVRLLLDEAREKPLPDEKLHASLKKDPTGATWMKKHIGNKDFPRDEGSLRLLSRSADLFSQIQL